MNKINQRTFKEKIHFLFVKSEVRKHLGYLSGFKTTCITLSYKKMKLIVM